MILITVTDVLAEYSKVKEWGNMKTRIISGVVMGVIVAAALALSFVSPLIIFIGIGICAGIAAFELLWNTGALKLRPAVAAAIGYMALAAITGYLSSDLPWFYFVTAIYVVAMIIIALIRHESITAHAFGYAIGVPIIVAKAFCSLASIIAIGDGKGIFYFLFLFNFASIADMGAYFVGSAIGKHKMAPVISPKKTIEGAVGGMLSSTLFSLIFVLVFNSLFDTSFVLWQWLVITPIFVILGMIGDLAASYIKRSFGIKDYGKLIPGHGGIMDRLDSMLIVAPFLQMFIAVTEALA